MTSTALGAAALAGRLFRDLDGSGSIEDAGYVEAFLAEVAQTGHSFSSPEFRQAVADDLGMARLRLVDAGGEIAHLSDWFGNHLPALQRSGLIDTAAVADALDVDWDAVLEPVAALAAALADASRKTAPR